MRQYLKIILLFLCFMQMPARAETVFWVDSKSGTAIGGYDPISFFLNGGAHIGNPNYEYFWQGAVWRFENEGNLHAFRDAPLIYSPQFGGFDATQIAHDLKVSPDPKYYTIDKNRLYLFHSQDTKKEWLANKEKYIKSGQANWVNRNVRTIAKNFTIIKKAEERISEFEVESAALNPDAEIDEKIVLAEPVKKAKKKKKKVEPISSGLTGSQRLGAAGDHFKNKRE